MSGKFLVTGASGHLGRRVLHHLLNTLGVAPARIVATSRRPENLAAWAAQGVTVRDADFDEAASLASAFAGIERALIISTDALDRPGRRLEQHRAAITAAEQAGVQHVVYTSMPHPKDSIVLLAPDHAATEDALAASKLPNWTVLRNHWYHENLFMTLPGILAMGGQWFSAAGEGKLANISRDDLGRAAAVVLAGTTSDKNVYTLSGEEALTTTEQAQVISKVLGKPIQVVQVPVEGLVKGLIDAGVPAPFAHILGSLDRNTAAGFVGSVTGDYRKLTGAAPQSFADWLMANKAAFGA